MNPSKYEQNFKKKKNRHSRVLIAPALASDLSRYQIKHKNKINPLQNPHFKLSEQIPIIYSNRNYIIYIYIYI